jgi:hypothetical protein
MRVPKEAATLKSLRNYDKSIRSKSGDAIRGELSRIELGDEMKWSPGLLPSENRFQSSIERAIKVFVKSHDRDGMELNRLDPHTAHFESVQYRELV